MRDPWVDIIASRLGPAIFTTSDEVRFNCPFTDQHKQVDTHAHMYVNTHKNKFFCQSCRKGGSLEYLASILGLPPPDSTLTAWQSLINNYLFGSSEVADSPAASLPLDYERIIQGTRAYAYVSSREISDKKLEYYHVGFGTAEYRDVPASSWDKYAGKDRVVLPDYDAKGRVTYWVARTYGKHTNKYKNAKVPRENQIYNLGNMERAGLRDRVVICEGPISAVVAGYDSVCTYGKHVTGSQVSKLVDYGAGEYVVAIDGDAISEAVSLATRLFRRGCIVRMIRFGCTEDPASVGSVEIRRRIRSSELWTPNSLMRVL